MSGIRRRACLYGATIALAGGLLFAGFGITIPPDAGTRLNGATLLAGMGEVDQALDICAQVLREHPDSLDARIFKATFLSMAHRHDEALAAYDDALAQEGVGTDLRLDLIQDRAGVLLDAGRTAEFDRERARLGAAGGEDRALVLDGVAAASRNEYARAIEAFSRARERRPDDAQLKARLWNVLLARGEEALSAAAYGEAEACFDAARELFPTAGRAFLKAAECRLARGDASGAVAVLKEAGPRTPGIAPLVFRAGTLLLEKGDFDGALDALDGALAVDPAGTRTLLQTEPVWRAHLDHPAVKAALEIDEEKADRFDRPDTSDR